MPTIATTTTVASNTVRVDADVAALFFWKKPISVPREERMRLPGVMDVAERFRASIAVHPQYILPAGSWSNDFIRSIYAPASARTPLSIGSWDLAYTNYTLRTNHQLLYNNWWWLPMDTAGIAALQPAYAWPILGVKTKRAASFFPGDVRIMLDRTQPVAGATLHNGYTSDGNLLRWSGTTSTPIHLTTSVINTLLVGGQLRSFARRATGLGAYDASLQGWTSIAPPSGKTLLILGQARQPTNTVPTPTVTVQIEPISWDGTRPGPVVTVGTYSYDNRQFWTVENTYLSGICIDVTLPTVSFDQSYLITANVSGGTILGGMTLSLREWDHDNILEGYAPPVPIARLDEGGYFPGMVW